MERIYADSSTLNKAIATKQEDTTHFTKNLNIKAKEFWFGFIFIAFIGFQGWGQTKVKLTTAGITNFSSPAGITSVTVEAWGAGGRGGNVNDKNNECGGGGGGAYSRSNNITVTPSTLYDVNVGAGSTTTAAGGDSYFKNTLTILAKGGSSVDIHVKTGASGGQASLGVGDTKFNGGIGATASNSSKYSGGGGSSAGTANNGNSGLTFYGGIAPSGGGNGGNGRSYAEGVGFNGLPPGGGGGGARTGSSVATYNGGAGAAGQVQISYFVLTNTVATTPICANNTSTITVSGSATDLPTGTYTVTYDLSSPNASTNNSTTFTSTAAGTLSFATISLAVNGTTTITITSITSGIYKTGYDNTGNAKNKADITVTPTVGTPSVPSGTTSLCQGASSNAYTTSATNATSYTWSVTGAGNSISGTGTTGTVTWASGFSGPATVGVKANGCGTSTESTTMITVSPASVSGTVTASANALCISTSTTVNLTGSTGNIQWQQSLDGSANWTNVGSGSILYTTPALSTNSFYRAVVTSGTCASATSNTAGIYISPSYTWKGGAEGNLNNWNTASNWQFTNTLYSDVPTLVPLSCSDVIIPSGQNHYPTISSAASCNNITIESGASLIDEGSYLTVANKSTMIREISDTRWHFLSSPVESQKIWPAFAPTPTGDPLTFGGEPWLWDFYYYNPNCPLPGKEWVNLRNNDGTYNSGDIDEGSNFAGFGPSIPTMTVAKGYLVAYASGSSTHKFEASTPNSFNTGNIGINFPNSKNVYNLIGNPYPSSLDWMNSNWDRTNLEKSGDGYDYWIMNDGVGTISGNYVVFNSGGTGSGSVSKDIAPGQAFWVKASGTGTLNLTIPNAARTHSTQAWLKNSNSETNLIRLHLKTSGNTYSDEMIVDINPVYSGNEGSDKLWSFYAEAPEIYAIKGGNNYTIDRYKDLNTNLTVNIGTKTGIAADYTLTATNIQEFNLSSKVLLEDLKTGIVTDLKQTPAYTFAGAPGDDANRFRLIIGSPIGIDEPNTNGSFNIYTYENMVYVQNDKINEPYFVTVSNMLGQTLVRTDFTGNSLNRIEMQNVPGVYVVNVVSNGKTYSQKVVIR